MQVRLAMEMTWARMEKRSATDPMLFAIMGFVFVAYLIIGLAMPVMPLYVRDRLGLNTFVVGLVAGAPFAAALLSRVFAGRHADGRGAKPAIIAGLLCATAGGVCYLLSTFVHAAGPSVAVLLLGRAWLGVADSFTITGALSWGLLLLGPQNTGKVMAWVGTALYAAFALGAPAGSILYAKAGFVAVSVATALIPVCALAALVPLRVPFAAKNVAHASLLRIARAVWQPGIALALSGVGFGAITAFIARFFADRGWMPVWPAFSVLSLAFIVGRLAFGTVPDRIGGAKVAFVCVLVEGLGLLLIWIAPSLPLALAGVALSGLGYSLVYPGLGVEALRRAPAASRGSAMGAYTAFLDLSLGVSGPVLGLIAGAAGLNAIFLVSASIVLLSAAVPVWLIRRST